MHRLLLLIPSLSYRTDDFLRAAERLGVEVVIASDQKQTLEEVVPGKILTLDFQNVEEATQKVLHFAKEYPLQAVVSTDEDATLLAAVLSEALSLPHNPVAAIAPTKDKYRFREVLTLANVPVPAYRLFSTEESPEEIARKVLYPCVLKPTFLSASRGVIRADNPSAFVSAHHRLLQLLNDPEVKRLGGPSAQKILVEDYIPGGEVALEGLLQKGELSLLALFDKPDPLEGPYFEETLYITPSRLRSSLQQKIVETTEQATKALDLRDGPIHAELRFNERGVVVIEVAARSIGGLCARTLRFGLGLSLEEIILRHALGMPIASLERQHQAAGVMMIPIPEAGFLTNVEGIKEAKKVSGIEEVTIMIRRKQKVIPLPEGRRYLGFIFSRGEKPEEVESSLREAHRKLKFTITPFERS